MDDALLEYFALRIPSRREWLCVAMERGVICAVIPLGCCVVVWLRVRVELVFSF